jgi:5'-nucleotidase
MRILVTNDDGVGAPGIAALAKVAVASGHEVVVVAPMVDYSGSAAAVGPVHSRDGVDYETHEIDGIRGVPVYGVDGPPALAVIMACVGAFGPVPDILLSGINHGVNVGRSALHSGTVGAALTAAHFGLRSLAVSMRYGPEPVAWPTPASLAAAAIPVLGTALPGTVLNLNVPDVALSSLRGLRRGRLARGGTIRSAVHAAEGSGHHPHVSLPPAPAGTLRLDLSPPGRSPLAEPDTDAGLVARHYASLTALVGVREAESSADTTVVGDTLSAVESAVGVGLGPPPGDIGVDAHSADEELAAG